jgi:hypothetical protein
LNPEIGTSKWRKQFQSPAMEGNKENGDSEISFYKLEVQVTNIFNTMTILMSSLESKSGLFKEQSIFPKDSKIVEEPETKIESSSSASSQLHFKV